MTAPALTAAQVSSDVSNAVALIGGLSVLAG